MFENEINGFEGEEYSELFGKRARARRAARKERRQSGLSEEQRTRRAKLKKAAGYLPPVAVARFGKKAFNRFRNRRRSGFDGEEINMDY